MVPPPEESRKKMKKYTLNITAAMLLLWSQSHLPLWAAVALLRKENRKTQQVQP